jgi:hypothetical protein
MKWHGSDLPSAGVTVRLLEPGGVGNPASCGSESTAGTIPTSEFHDENQPLDFLIDACYSAKIERKKAATFPAYDHRNL